METHGRKSLRWFSNISLDAVGIVGFTACGKAETLMHGPLVARKYKCWLLGLLKVDVGCTDVGYERKSGVKGGPQVFALGHIGGW